MGEQEIENDKLKCLFVEQALEIVALKYVFGKKLLRRLSAKKLSDFPLQSLVSKWAQPVICLGFSDDVLQLISIQTSGMGCRFDWCLEQGRREVFSLGLLEMFQQAAHGWKSVELESLPSGLLWDETEYAKMHQKASHYKA